MSTPLAALTQQYVNSAVTTIVNAAIDTLYVIDTAANPVTVNLPNGVNIGDWIVIQNAPANGPQMGGSTPGNNITINATGGETIEGSASINRSPPTSLITAATTTLFPTGSASGSSGFGAGWVH